MLSWISRAVGETWTLSMMWVGSGLAYRLSWQSVSYRCHSISQVLNCWLQWVAFANFSMLGGYGCSVAGFVSRYWWLLYVFRTVYVDQLVSWVTSCLCYKALQQRMSVQSLRFIAGTLFVSRGHTFTWPLNCNLLRQSETLWISQWQYVSF